ncbi:MAG: methylated-DNA--[protein]-cysteine S-methyltransferase [Paludibacteraceae bacterium]
MQFETPIGTLAFPLPTALSDQLQSELSAYFRGARRTFSPNLMEAAEQAISNLGTPFQQSVWRALMHIPYSATVSYSDLARRIGRPRAVRAVASACGANPFPVLIPCHRVVAKNGIGGFALGIPAKQHLLRLETE